MSAVFVNIMIIICIFFLFNLSHFCCHNLKVIVLYNKKPKCICVLFGQSCMCLDQMLIVFSFLKEISDLTFFHTHLNMIKILVILQNKSGEKQCCVSHPLYTTASLSNDKL